MHENAAVGGSEFVSRGVVASSFVAPMASEPMSFRDTSSAQQYEAAARATERLSSTSRHGHSISYGGREKDLASEPVAVFLLRGRPGSAGGSATLPGLRDSGALFHEQEMPNHVS